MASLLNKVKSAIFKEPILPKIDQITSKFLNSEGKWRTIQFNVDSDWKGVRIDSLLTKKFDISASLAQKLIRTKKVWIERESKRISAIKSNLRLLQGDSVNLSEIFLPERKTRIGPLSAAQEAHLKDWTIFEDETLLVLNKPSGIAVHTGPNMKISIDELLQKRSQEHRLIHRLDRGTSGVLLVGKSRGSTEKLQNLFKGASKDLESTGLTKTYLALVAGTPKDRQGQIKTTIYKAKRSIGPGSASEPQMTTEMSKREDLLDEGSVAITDYRMISSHMTKIGGVRVKLSLMEFKPKTGKTHQIRVHAAEQLGCPIVGDTRYGLTTIYNLAKIPGIGQGLHLHCKSIEIPVGLAEVSKFEAPLPKHFIKTLNKFPIRVKPPRPRYNGK
jgi:23S rRNA pseudouridine955/2504/2580 synthase